jgi:single-stranded-DNA-specific exonuclease
VARRRHLSGRLGGYALCSWDALERTPQLAAGMVHLVALDPPAHPDHEAVLHAGAAATKDGGFIHLAWGEPELRCSRDVLDRDHALRPSLVGAYRALRDGSDLGAALGRRPVDGAARVLAVLLELGLVALDDDGTISVPAAGRTDLERSPTFSAAARHHAEAVAWLTSESVTSRAA